MEWYHQAQQHLVLHRSFCNIVMQLLFPLLAFQIVPQQHRMHLYIHHVQDCCYPIRQRLCIVVV